MFSKKTNTKISIPAAVITIVVIVALVIWALTAEKRSSVKHHKNPPSKAGLTLI